MSQHYPYYYCLGREDVNLESKSESGSGRKWERPRRFERHDCDHERGARDSEAHAKMETASRAPEQRDFDNFRLSRAEDEFPWANTPAALTGDTASPGSGSVARGQEHFSWLRAFAHPGATSPLLPSSLLPPAPHPRPCLRRRKALQFRPRRTDDRLLSVREGLYVTRLLVLGHYQGPFPLTNNDFLRIQEYCNAGTRGRSPVRKPAEWYMFDCEATGWREQASSSEAEKTVMNILLQHWGWGGDDVETNSEFAKTFQELFRQEGSREPRCASGCACVGCGGNRIDSPRPGSGYSASSESLDGKEGGIYGWSSDSEDGDGGGNGDGRSCGGDGDGNGDGDGDGDCDERGQPLPWRIVGNVPYEHNPGSSTAAYGQQMQHRLHSNVGHLRSRSGRGKERERSRIDLHQLHQIHYCPVPPDECKAYGSDAGEEGGGEQLLRGSRRAQ